MSKEALYNPTHPNANIHGMTTAEGEPTCATENPEIRCTGCCFLKVPEIPASKITVEGRTHIKPEPDGKPELARCIFHERGDGCGKLLGGDYGEYNSVDRPQRCCLYHCSHDRQIYTDPFEQEGERTGAKQRLLACLSSSLKNGECSEKTAGVNMANVIETPPFYEDEDSGGNWI